MTSIASKIEFMIFCYHFGSDTAGTRRRSTGTLQTFVDYATRCLLIVWPARPAHEHPFRRAGRS
jgi:hypothetical protein